MVKLGLVTAQEIGHFWFSWQWWNKEWSDWKLIISVLHSPSHRKVKYNLFTHRAGFSHYAFSKCAAASLHHTNIKLLSFCHECWAKSVVWSQRTPSDNLDLLSSCASKRLGDGPYCALLPFLSLGMVVMALPIIIKGYFFVTLLF